MFELTIAQAIIVALALIIGTIILAQPFRRKVHYMKLEDPEIETLAKAILRHLNEDRLAEYILGGMAMLIENVSKNSVVAFPRKDMTLEEQKKSVRSPRSKKFPGLYATTGFKVIKVKSPETLLTKKNTHQLFEATLAPKRKSRAGEKRLPSRLVLPADATPEQIKEAKRLLKNRLKTRAYRAKKRAELKK